MKGRRAALALAFVAAMAALPARAQTVPKMLVVAASVPMIPSPSTATTAVAQCDAGTTLIGGGMLAAKPDPANPMPPSPALRGKGSYPSDVTGVPVN